jgi:Ni/Fe-hydrogenase b-type cytochrome subunit
MPALHEAAMKKKIREYQHTLIVRLSHWTNFGALAIMVCSGLRIFNASPLFDLRFPKWILLGGWLGGARMWHFAAMWIFVLNGIIAVLYNIFTRHGRKTTIFRETDIKGVFPMIKYYLRIEKEHPRSGKYNPLQKLAYTSTPFLGIGVVLSGLAMYMPVQLQLIASVFGGYDLARWIHFLFMAALVLFFAGHIIMVITAGWSNFVPMITGWKRLKIE